eukprot:268327_1
MSREKCALNEAGYIANVIKKYGQLRFSSAMAMKNMVKSYVLTERREPKTVKWSTKVEIFEDKLSKEQINDLWDYRVITQRKCVFGNIQINTDGDDDRNDNISKMPIIIQYQSQQTLSIHS